MERLILLIIFSFKWVHYTNTGIINDFSAIDSILFAGTNGGFVIINMERDSIIQKYTGSEGLLQNEINVLEKSIWDGIWLGYAGKGISYFKDGNLENYDFSQVRSTYIFDLLFYNNYLIICDTNSLKVLWTKGTENIHDDNILIERVPEWSYNNLIKYVSILKDTIFLASKNSVYYQSFEDFINGISPDTLISNIPNINSLKRIGDSLFILTQNGFYIYPSLSLKMNWAKIFDIEKKDSIYIVGTNTGVFEWNPLTGEINEIFNSSEWKRVYVYKDKIFAGNCGRKDLNTGKGIFVYKDSLYSIKGKIREIAGNMISSIFSYKKGFVSSFRVTSEYNGLSIVYYDGKIFDALNNWVRGVCVFDDKIIAARFGGGGMFLIDSVGNLIDTIFGTSYVFHTVKYIPSESLIIASSPNVGIVFYSFKGLNIPPKSFQEWINDVEWDNGVIWAGTSQVIKIDLGENWEDPIDDKVEFFDTGENFAIIDMEVDENYIYIASTNGFYIYKKEPFGKYLNLTKFLPHPLCLGVEIDKRKDLWILTLKGLVKIKYGYKDYEWFLPGPYSMMEICDPGENPQLTIGSEVIDVDEQEGKIICGTLKGIAVLELKKDYYKETSIDSVLIYPNPLSRNKDKYIYIYTLSEIQDMKIFRLDGKKMNLKIERINRGYKIDIKDFEPGIYILRIKKAGKTKFLKFSVI
jgi:hypothetical protein